MTKSGLTNSVVLADNSNYNKGRFGYNVCKITPHHMCGILSGTQCAKIFQNPSRNASANYCIGNDGDIVLSVAEENRAWTSSNKLNDCQAITIEVSNSSLGGDYPISDKAWKSLIDLCVDICRRYNFRLNYTGDKNGSLTRHNMFANTDCPGPYLQSKLPELANIVNSRLDGTTPQPVATDKSIEELARDVIAGKYGNGEARRNALGSKYAEVQARVNEILNGSTPSTPNKSIDEIARDVIAGKYGNGNDRKTRLEQAGYNYSEVQARVNQMLSGNNSKSNIDDVARDVIAGKYGNGQERKDRLASAGYNYSEVQARVNEMLK